ncbi:MFS transporter [Streptomyces sp. NBC_01465]|uniref:MFS transporter n=1 Tax=Streptomyces sp. NBC_01465 TaxID=2903878 RepID=UPI002E35742B|nr:MFS transporter [Streptomyces sp. NBC_01465]
MMKRYGMRSYVAGAALARTGDEMSGPALLLAGLAATGSASSASSLLAGLTVSAAVGGPVFGMLLDRAERPGRLLAGALGAYAGALVLILVSLGRVPVVCTVLVAVGAGLLGPALSGGWTAQLPYAVGPERLPRANALDAMTFNFAGLAGPAAAGLVASLAGAPAGVAVAAALICCALPAAWGLPRVHTRTAMRASPLAGFRAVLRSRPLTRATSVSVASCMSEGMLVACCPLLGAEVLGGAGRGALLLTAVAASALATNALLARARRVSEAPERVIGASALAQAAALAMAATLQPPLLIGAMVLAGAAQGPQLTALFAIRHREAPDHLRGQIFTTGASLKLTGFAAGAALAGPLATRSLPAALLTSAGIALLASLTPTTRSQSESLRRPARPAGDPEPQEDAARQARA